MTRCKVRACAALGAALLIAAWPAAAAADAAPRCRSDRASYAAGARAVFACDASPVPGETLRLRTLSRRQHDYVLPLPASGKIVWRVPADAQSAAYAVHRISADGQARYEGFFRVLAPGQLDLFRIDHQRYRGLDVLRLDGGMSAEYAVEKAAENLLAGVSHSWQVSAPGSGPRPVFATPDFLDRALRQTVEIYDKLLGAERPFDNVVIATGVPSAPYLARALDAPILPVQFLVSADSVQEIASVLDTAAGSGHAAYSTLSHDPSVENAVAWIKLRDLPAPYRDFLRRHRVKNLYLLGSTNTDGGETRARRVLGRGEPAAYDAGSIYVMYPGTSPDDQRTLEHKLADLSQFPLATTVEEIADWESGIAGVQASALSTSACAQSDLASVVSLSSANLMDLYDLASFAGAAFLARNPPRPARDGVFNGLRMNPYLIGHPSIEAWNGEVPVVFWQGNPPDAMIARAQRLADTVAAAYFPDVVRKDLGLAINVTRNFGGVDVGRNLAAAAAQGWRHGEVVVGDASVDEVWNPADGMHAPGERLAAQLIAAKNVGEFQTWSRRAKPLAEADFVAMRRHLPGLQVQTRRCADAR
jgi:hypothetical protein